MENHSYLFLNNTKTFEMMKFMITIIIENTNNQNLKLKLEKPSIMKN